MTQTSTMTSSALSRRPRPAPAVWHAPDWQRLWLSTQQQPRSWRSLALVPAGKTAPPSLIVQVAVALSHTGTSHLGGAVQVADGLDIELDQLMPFRDELQRATQGQDRVLVALPALSRSVTALPLAQLADVCLLCILQGVDTTKEVKQTVDSIGASRIIGAAMFRPGS